MILPRVPFHHRLMRTHTWRRASRLRFIQLCSLVGGQFGSVLSRISEESEQLPYEERRHYECCWVVDPLDGTKVRMREPAQLDIET